MRTIKAVLLNPPTVLFFHKEWNGGSLWCEYEEDAARFSTEQSAVVTLEKLKENNPILAPTMFQSEV